MINAIKSFNACIADINHMRAFYTYLNTHCSIPKDDLTDLLRAELVNIVSAMDRFIHEMVRIGIINSFTGSSTPTDKCKSMPLRFDTMQEVVNCISRGTPPTSIEETAEYWINKAVVTLLKTMSFQKIDKIKDALSYIWDEQHKIQALINKMRYSYPSTVITINNKQKYIENKIDLIVNRRNQIVHEADYDISTHSKRTIEEGWLDDTISFIKEFVYSLYENITNDTTYIRL